MQIHTKEFQEIMEQFEKVYSPDDFRKENKDLWNKQIFYCNGEINKIFIGYCNGYAHARSVYLFE